MVDRLVEGRLFKEHDVEVKNLKSEDNGDTATVTVTIQNKKEYDKDIKVLMRHLGDGTWVIYDILILKTYILSLENKYLCLFNILNYRS